MGRVGIWAVLFLAASVVVSPAFSAPQTDVHADAFAWPTMSVSLVLPGGPADPPSVLENGTPTQALDATPLGSADTVAIAVDHSQSMRGRPIGTALAIAKRLLQDEPSGTRIAVFAIASKAVQKTGLSKNRAKARAALAGIRIDPHYGTRLYDGVALAAHALQRAGGHRLLILITDGQETTSSVGISGAVSAALRGGVPVLPVAVSDSTYEPGLLTELARATNGAFLGNPAHSPAQAAQAAKDVRRSWRIDYVTLAKPGQTVSLRISQRGSAPVSTDVTIPDSPPAKGFFSRNERTLVIAAGVAAIVLVVLGLADRRRARSWVSHLR
jgi:hypothetical protein